MSIGGVKISRGAGGTAGSPPCPFKVASAGRRISSSVTASHLRCPRRLVRLLGHRDLPRRSLSPLRQPDLEHSVHERRLQLLFADPLRERERPLPLAAKSLAPAETMLG